MNDSYKTIKSANDPVLFKDKGSKFYGYAFPMQQADMLSHHIDGLKKEHHSARHWCYAYQLGAKYDSYRVNDDGEPGNSAGQPILGQIQAFELTDVLVVVVRYFGGTKLGVGGLINAYRTASKMALDACQIETRTIDIAFSLRCPYSMLSRVMRLVKDFELTVVDQQSAQDVLLKLRVRASKYDELQARVADLYPVAFIPTKNIDSTKS